MLARTPAAGAVCIFSHTRPRNNCWGKLDLTLSLAPTTNETNTHTHTHTHTTTEESREEDTDGRPKDTEERHHKTPALNVGTAHVVTIAFGISTRQFGTRCERCLVASSQQKCGGSCSGQFCSSQKARAIRV